jgi:transposase-like protein
MSNILEDVRYDPGNLFDTVKSQLDINRDSALALLLGVEASSIGKIRSKLIPIGPVVLERMRNATGLSLTTLRSLMLAGKATPTIKKQKKTVPPSRADQIKIPAAKPVNEDSRNRYPTSFKLDAVRMISETETCHAVANRLALPTQTLHNWFIAYKTGKLGHRVRLNAEEISYIRTVLKRRSAEITKKTSEHSKQEKNFLTTLQNKLDAIDGS